MIKCHIYPKQRIITPDFKKQLPRDADSNTNLPGFMQVFLINIKKY